MKLSAMLMDYFARGIELRLEGDKLKLVFGAGQLSAHDQQVIGENKAAIIALFCALEVRSNRDFQVCSYSQQRLWLLDKIEPDSSQYNMSISLRLDGRLDADALQQALATLVARHEVLRTVYRTDLEGDLLQVVLAHDLPLRMLAVAGADGPARLAAAQELAQQEAARPFALASDPMLRALLLRLSEQSHVLLITVHHIAADGWSSAILMRELRALYTAFSQGQPAPLAPLKVQYKDYAHWQRGALSGASLEQLQRYWEQRLAQLPVVHSLPLDFARPALADHRSDSFTAHLPAALVTRLNALAAAHGATLFMLLNAAFAVLLARHSGEDDIAIGTPIANREQAETAALVGFFVNTLVIRNDLSGNPSFAALLQQSRANLLGAYAHQQMPFDKLVETLRPERSLSHAPLFQIMLVLQNYESEAPGLPGLDVTPLPWCGGAAKFDLTLLAKPEQGALQLEWEFAAALFARDSMTRMAGHFEVLLEAIAAAPDTPIRQLALLGAAEERQLLVDWNATAAPFPGASCIHELVEARAAQCPHAPALMFGERVLTYRVLNEQANQLAHHLRALGAGPEQLVGVCVDRSLEMVIALLAILKAGAAYVPLDPAYPAARIAYMLTDSGARFLVTQRHLLASLPAFGGQLVCLDDPQQQAQWRTRPCANIAKDSVGLGPRHLAYVIYTSGSTGQPKGVMIEHRNAVAFLAWSAKAYSASEWRRVLAATSICFDLSIYELFGTLCAGGTAVLVADVLALPQVAEQDITLINTVPSAIKALIEARSLPPSVKTVNLAGEPLAQSVVEALYALGVERVMDLYGPSEDTTYSTCALRTAGGRNTIGKAIDNTVLLVLSPQLAVQPVGVAGQLHIGGAGLARGYLNRPDLSAEKFIDNPFAQLPCDRLYRTGDLVRLLADGNLEYLGRIDNQVKIRGFRIELGEVEAALLAHPALTEAAALVSADGARIVAYVVKNTEDDIGAELRLHLKLRLPDYMLPSVLIYLAHLPQTQNGKLDRKALPAPDQAPGRERAYVAPATATERQLCTIWQEVLGLGQVGVGDSFFELGGHSLLALKLVDRINRSFKQTLPVASLFRFPDIAQLSLLLDGAPSGRRDDDELVLFREGNAALAPLLLVHPIGGSSLCYRELVGALDYPGPVWGIEQRAEAGAAGATVQDLAARYAGALLGRGPLPEVCLFGWSFGGVVAYEMAALLAQRGVRVHWLGMVDSHARLDAGGHALAEHAVAAFARDAGFGPRELADTAAVSGGSVERALAHLLKVGRDRGVLPRDTTLAELSARYRLTEDNLARLFAYQPSTWQGAAHFFRAGAPVAPAPADPRPLWQALLPTLVCIDLDADHFSIIKGPHARTLAGFADEALSGALA